FADVPDWISAPAARIGLWFQFTPSLLSLTQGIGWLSLGCLAVLALTLLVGRVYCSMLCPLGILMDLSAWLAGRTGRNRKLPYKPGKTTIRIAAVAICTVGLALGTAVPLGLLDPYSIFGKIVTATIRPLAGWTNQLISQTGLTQPYDFSPVAWATAGVALGLLALIVITAIFRGRLWCNTACPVGAILGFFSKFSLFRLHISSSQCVACSLCERTCPAQCIDFKNHRIDHSRCIMCLNCVTSCKRNGIHLTTGKLDRGLQSAPTSEPIPHLQSSIHDPLAKPLPRRAILGASLAIPAAALAEKHQGNGPGNGKGRGNASGQGIGGGQAQGHGNGHGNGHDPKYSCSGPNRLTQFNKTPSLPPGAKSLRHFQSHCTACQLCVANCPEQVLRPSITKHGLAGFLQPYQDFEVSFCSFNCSNCSDVCPTGAIQPLTIEDRQHVQTGVAQLFRSRCVVKTEGTSCGACAEHCPTGAVHMVPWKNGLTIPEVDPDLCVGCGGCEFICPVRPDKAIIVVGHTTHQKAKLPELGDQNTVRKIEEEFPF
ncbi:MAG: 4Fe-4S binding protein, partial [Verrucomicrobiales bacterium]